MSVRAGVNRFSIDANLVLRAAGKTAITASAASDSSYTLDWAGGYWTVDGAFDVATLIDFAVIANVESIATSGNQTYVITVQVATDAAFTTPLTVETVTVTATGRSVLTVARENIVAALGTSATSGFLRAYATLGGTSPSLGWNAFIAPLVGEA